LYAYDLHNNEIPMRKPSDRESPRLRHKPADFWIHSAGDAALVLEFEARIDPSINARVVAVAALIDRLGLKGVLDVVPAYRSVTVYYSPLLMSDASLKAQLADVAGHPAPSSPTRKRIVEIPVCYGDEFGPDLRAVSAISGLRPPEIIDLHTSRVYRVYMMGFLPGFPYMAEVAPAIAVPRLPAPRRSVPAGSVGIADAQTGIYPVDSPGGWRIIGITPMQIYDPGRRRPFRLAAGDRVRFRAIDRQHFDRLCQERTSLQT